MSDTKIPLLLFSGGADSTLRLQELLGESNVAVVYGSAGQHPLKREMELHARQAIIKELERHSRFRVEQQLEMDVSSLRINGDFQFQQILPWLVTGLTAFDTRRHSRIEMAFLMNDDIMVNRHALEESWKHLVSLLFHEKAEVPLHLPLKYCRKSTVYSRLSAKLQSLIWVCEMPVKGRAKKHKPCRKCMACKNQKTVLSQE